MVQTTGHEHTCHITYAEGPSNDHTALAEECACHQKTHEDLDQAQQILETQYTYTLHLTYLYLSIPSEMRLN